MAKVIPNLCEQHIRRTQKEVIVSSVTVFLCRLTKAVIRGISVDDDRIYVNTRVLKHIYDKRPAEEFDFLVDNIHKVVKYPDQVYKNKDSKRGDFCFIKKIGNCTYFCSLEKETEDIECAKMCVVTAFRIKDKYIKNYELLWSWKGDNPSS